MMVGLKELHTGRFSTVKINDFNYNILVKSDENWTFSSINASNPTWVTGSVRSFKASQFVLSRHSESILSSICATALWCACKTTGGPGGGCNISAPPGICDAFGRWHRRSTGEVLAPRLSRGSQPRGGRSPDGPSSSSAPLTTLGNLRWVQYGGNLPTHPCLNPASNVPHCLSSLLTFRILWGNILWVLRKLGFFEPIIFYRIITFCASYLISYSELATFILPQGLIYSWWVWMPIFQAGSGVFNDILLEL